jgi:hemolysin activation/secretion protein
MTTRTDLSRLLAAATAAVAFALPATAQVPAAPPSEPTIDVTRFVLEGDLPLSPAEVQAVLVPFTGPKKTLRDIDAAAQAVEQALRSRGYAFHRLYVPPQRPTAGEIRLAVVTFKVGTVEVSGQQHFSEANIRRALVALREGETPDVETLGAEVSASNTNPAKQVVLSFREARQPSTVDVQVRVQDAPPVAFIASLTANQAVSGPGPENNVVRLTGSWQHSNLFDRDHVATLSYTTDPRRPGALSQYGLYYQVPVYAYGMSISGYYTQSDISTGRIQQGAGFFDVSGSGKFYGLRLTKPLARTGTLQRTVSVALDDRLFQNSTTFNGLQIQPDVGSRVLSLQGSLRDEVSFGTWGTSLEYATNIGGGPSNTDPSHALNGGKRAWGAWRYTADLTVPVSRWQVVGRIRGQHSGDPLISGEQIGLGGYSSVRGFGERVVAGERGWQWNVEATGPALWRDLRPVVFTDGGRVHARSTGRTETIASAGAGVRWLQPGLQVALDLARVIDDLSTATGSKAIRLNLGVLTRF